MAVPMQAGAVQGVDIERLVGSSSSFGALPLHACSELFTALRRTVETGRFF